MKRLTESEFDATFSSPMQRVPADGTPPVDFWKYFDTIPNPDFEGHDCSENSVRYAWNDSTGRYQHVLVDTEDKNVFMVIVLDIPARVVVGHHLLNLNRLYGLEDTVSPATDQRTTDPTTDH